MAPLLNWKDPRTILTAALALDGFLLLAANLLLSPDEFLILVGLLLAEFAALLYVHPHRWVIANGVFALALYAVVLAGLKKEWTGPVDSPDVVDALTGAFGLVTVIVAAVGAMMGPFAAHRARAGAGFEAVAETPRGARRPMR